MDKAPVDLKNPVNNFVIFEDNANFDLDIDAFSDRYESLLAVPTHFPHTQVYVCRLVCSM